VLDDDWNARRVADKIPAMKSQHPLIFVLGLVAFAMNPALACSSADEPEFDYGEPQMASAVEGLWNVTFTRPGPEGATTVTLRIEKGTARGALPASAIEPQCGTRTFMRPAGACSPGSQLMLVAAVVDTNQPLDLPAGKGSFNVPSLKFGPGWLALTFDEQLKVNSRIDPGGTTTETYVTWQGARLAEATLQRAP
jgi:hypothetical protein